jgi:diguanylate cyclase (GGDEF)-like protein
MSGPHQGAARRGLRLRVGGKFSLAVGVVLLAMLTVTLAGSLGLARMEEQISALYDDNIVTSQETTQLELALRQANGTALQLIVTADPQRKAALEAGLDEAEIPLIEQQLSTLNDLIGHDPGAPERLQAIATDFDSFLALRRTGAYDAANGQEDAEERTAAHTAELFGRMVDSAAALDAIERDEADAADRSALGTYRSTLWELIVGSGIALVVGLTVVLLLIRSLVPRIRSYSAFAGQIAAGRPSEQLTVTGSDELTELGDALNEMVSARQRLSSYESAQTEFIETLQATSSEDEAHGLLKRHLERSLPGSGVTVLTRNNSNNRLEAATAPPEGDPVGARLLGAEPRSCLALRLGRPHREGKDDQLLECRICQHGAQEQSTCEPLLVSGEVIGSVLVGHDQELDPQQDSRIALTVAQAAPVLANLRNLALAEFRANNDSLTGLPNKRATDDTFKRMIAQAHRSIAPLAVLMLDLDHFKKVNDQYGHGKGDEVLAGVGAAIDAILRQSDFAGRYGGEEFLILLPDTSSLGAARLAERLRESITAIVIPGIDRGVTASIGIAELVEHGGTPAGLLREADRALYAAKAAGRNRSMVARIGEAGDVIHTDASTLLPAAEANEVADQGVASPDDSDSATAQPVDASSR